MFGLPAAEFGLNLETRALKNPSDRRDPESHAGSVGM